MILYYNR